MMAAEGERFFGGRPRRAVMGWPLRWMRRATLHPRRVSMSFAGGVALGVDLVDAIAKWCGCRWDRR